VKWTQTQHLYMYVLHINIVLAYLQQLCELNINSILSNEDEIDGLSRNVGKKVPLYAANNPTRAQISFTPRR